MNEVVKKVLRNGIIPIMTDEGILKIFNYYFDRSRNKKQLYTMSGPSRTIRLESSKKRIDNLNFDENLAKNHITSEMYKLFGNSFCGDITEQKPFGQNKSGADDVKHGYDNRIYINAPFGEIRYQFVELFAKKCVDRKLVCEGKFFHKSAEEASIDNMILYAKHNNVEKYLEILEEIKVELPEFAKCCGSPIASGLNISYYAFSHSGNNSPTYNDWFNEISEKAYDVLMARNIASNPSYFDTLTFEQKKLIKTVSTSKNLTDAVIETKKSGGRIAGLTGFNLSEQKIKLFRQIVEGFVSTNPVLSRDYIINELRGGIQAISSIINWGDEEHINYPVALKKSDYAALGIGPEEIKDKNALNEYQTSEAGKVSKKTYSKARIKKILNSDERQIRIEAILAGYTVKDTIDKTEQELRMMVFDKVTLDNESIIDILCSDTVQLKRTLIGLGVKSQSIFEKNREQLEKMFIEKMGLDNVIFACDDIKRKEEKNVVKRIHVYENSLQAMRMQRGKEIVSSDKFKSIKTKKEKIDFINKLSPTELEDAKNYYLTHQNVNTITDLTSRSI